jgi:hypothetical protein
MFQCDVSNIREEIYCAENRILQQQIESTRLVHTCPANAMRIMEQIAADRARCLHLSLLMRGLSTDYDDWSLQSVDQRMEREGFQRIGLKQQLYLRRRTTGIDLSDLVDVMHLEPETVEQLVRVLHRR